MYTCIVVHTELYLADLRISLTLLNEVSLVEHNNHVITCDLSNHQALYKYRYVYDNVHM